MNKPFEADKSFETDAQTRYRLRSMTEADLPAIMSIEQRAHSHPWRQEHFENCLKAGNLALVVESTCDGPTPMAYALTSVGGGQADLLNLVVAPEAQRQGIAKQLLGCVVDLLNGRADSLFLEVRESNYRAINLYEQLGFNEVGCRPNYYPAHNGREDALVLALTLSLPDEER